MSKKTKAKGKAKTERDPNSKPSTSRYAQKLRLRRKKAARLGLSPNTPKSVLDLYNED
jgi:hypothetical protein